MCVLLVICPRNAVSKPRFFKVSFFLLFRCSSLLPSFFSSISLYSFLTFLSIFLSSFLSFPSFWLLFPLPFPFFSLSFSIFRLFYYFLVFLSLPFPSSYLYFPLPFRFIPSLSFPFLLYFLLLSLSLSPVFFLIRTMLSGSPLQIYGFYFP